jgi:3-isopropylmalate/(R)-2-methylmalate dehydratase large subunit
VEDIVVTRAFIGSSTNSSIDDLRDAARVVRGRKVAGTGWVILVPGDRCASSTKRDFEGHQGAGARAYLMSPAMIAAATIAGRLAELLHLELRN